MDRKDVNPWEWSKAFGFSQAVQREGAQRIVLCSGQTATGAVRRAAAAELSGSVLAPCALGVGGAGAPPAALPLEVHAARMSMARTAAARPASPCLLRAKRDEITESVCPAQDNLAQEYRTHLPHD